MPTYKANVKHCDKCGWNHDAGWECGRLVDAGCKPDEPRWKPGSLAADIACPAPRVAMANVLHMERRADAVERLVQAARAVLTALDTHSGYGCVVEFRAAVEAAENWGKR